MTWDDELRELLDADAAERNALLRRLVETLAAAEEHVVALRSAAHDLRNPLAVLGTQTLQLREWLDESDPRQRELLEDHEAAVAQCEALIDRLLRLGRESAVTGGLRSQPVDVAAFARRLERRLGALANDRRLSSSLRLEADAPSTVEVDPLVLDRVVYNLIGNAIAHTTRGAVDVVLGASRLDWLVLELADTGGGLPPDVLQRLVDGDLAALERPDGHGIGLSVVVDLLRRIGGRLEVSSREGRGTTFWCWIPVRPRSVLSSSGVRPASRRVVTLRDDAARGASGTTGR